MHKKILIVGAGFSGAVIARELADTNQYQITVIEERGHIAGNCYTERDAETNIMEHVYGPHIFNTSNEKVWNYIQKYGEFIPNINRVKAVTENGVFSMPINLLTINQFFNKSFNPREAADFIASKGGHTIIEAKNFEEQALKLIGKELYENFFKGYTIKQWGCDPKELPASILSRLPIRFNYDDNYYNSKFQGIPRNGYTEVVYNLLKHENIKVILNTKYTKEQNNNFDHIFYAGPLDGYFNFSLGKLAYRSIYFEKEVFDGEDYQGNPVINYCSESVPYTRIHEHKHFTPWEKHEKSIYFKEYSKETEDSDIPYYPKRLATDKELLRSYRHLAENENNITFIGRLGTYRYMDMHHVIDEALNISEDFIKTGDTTSFYKFLNSES
ncbi:UDP-galactopyranose mutase [Pedobacter sp. AK013]|uniref:UDP-galactopyranose mutase n=1 Tax=Pedobacter sp. AK013 TaxID=2723071 RepID=UPI00161AD79F|nr:UDP-galactopyranose mutase [Pedobacter sp. AK013]MBB6235491.1 UDP-galactopyranose mutase [Pedobacter sp. AK013]